MEAKKLMRLLLESGKDSIPCKFWDIEGDTPKKGMLTGVCLSEKITWPFTDDEEDVWVYAEPITKEKQEYKFSALEPVLGSDGNDWTLDLYQLYK